jgi:hypothetical protein
MTEKEKKIGITDIPAEKLNELSLSMLKAIQYRAMEENIDFELMLHLVAHTLETLRLFYIGDPSFTNTAFAADSIILAAKMKAEEEHEKMREEIQDKYGRFTEMT